MYNEKIEALIKAALADGELTEKEKQILFKRAESEGIDLDEFEMVLSAKLYERNNAPKADITAHKSEKFGDVRKCPSCGSILQSFQIKCDDCGYEFKNVEAVGSAQRLFDLLQAAELRKTQRIQEQEQLRNKRLRELDQEKDLRLKELSERYNSDSTITKLFGGKKRIEAQNKEREDLIIEMENTRTELLETLDNSVCDIEEQVWNEKLSIIETFPVPNTKEDLLEILAMATGNAYNNDTIVGDMEKAWIQKVNQIYSKIQVCASDDTALIDQATSMVSGLLQKLPNKYKQYIQIPESAKTNIKLAAKTEMKMKMEIYLSVFKIAGPICFVFVVLAIIGFVADIEGLMLIGPFGAMLTLVIANYIVNKKITSK